MKLFEGILQSAQTEATTILERAKQDAQAVQTSYEKKIADALEKEKKATAKRLEQIQRLEESSIRNLRRRHSVGRSERLRQLVLESVAQKMALLQSDPAYRQIVIHWIAEAALGLDREEARVSCSFRESLDESMLREAEDIVRKATGKRIHLQLHDKPLTSQGVEVSTLDGKIAFNNQVTTRLIRHDRNLKELMEGQQCQKE